MTRIKSSVVSMAAYAAMLVFIFAGGVGAANCPPDDEVNLHWSSTLQETVYQGDALSITAIVDGHSGGAYSWSVVGNAGTITPVHWNNSNKAVFTASSTVAGYVQICCLYTVTNYQTGEACFYYAYHWVNVKCPVSIGLIRVYPSASPMLLNGAFEYQCQVDVKEGYTIESYSWYLDHHCNTDSSDPYGCPCNSSHNSTLYGPHGSIWSGGVPSHCGNHSIRCVVKVNGKNYTATSQLEVIPPMNVLSCTIKSPSSTGSWPYDPIYDDPLWEPSIDGSVAGACCLNTDVAKIKFTLNKKAARYEVRLYRNTFGWGNVPVLETFGSSANRGVNSVDWRIKTDVADNYFAEAKAWGSLGDSSKKESSDANVSRRSFFTCDTTSVTLGEILEVWEMTDEVYNACLDVGQLGVVAGATYLLPASYVAYIVAGEFGFIAADNFLGWTQAPAWMDSGNGTYQFPPWYLREWCWSKSDYGYKSTGILFPIFSSATYDDVTPSEGDEPLVYHFFNDWNWIDYGSPAEYESEFGLLPPEIIIE